jgi:hypothetical protein
MSLPYDVSGHTDCSAPLGVVVHQEDGGSVRLPVIDDGLQLYERKIGPTSITRRAEVTVPIEGQSGHNWLQYVTAFRSDDSEESSAIQTADIIGQPIGDNGQAVGEPAVLFRGYVAAIGSSDGVNRARFRILDPMKFLSRIEAGVSFQDVTPTDVLNYVRDRFVDEQPVFSDVSVDTDGVDNRVIRDVFKRLETVRRLLNDEKIIGEVITFSANRDTLTDVLQWLMNRTETRVWFQPTGERGIALTAVRDDANQYDLTPSSANPPRVIKNNALYEMRPFNAVRLKGNTGKRIEVGEWGVAAPFGDTYPEATATYPPLIDRFGGRLSQTGTSKTTDAARLEREAKSKLKQELDEFSGGSMVTTLAPMVRPFDRVEATPACSGVTADVDALTYEVQEATHSIVPGDNNVPRTTLSVSMAVDPSKIEVRSSVRDARTGGEPSDNDPMDEYEFDYGTAP